LAEVKAIEFGPWSQIISLEWAPDGRFLAVSAGNLLILVDPQTWDVVLREELAATAPGLAISPDSRYLAAASRDGRLSVWEIGAGDPLRLAEMYSLEVHRKGANQAAFSPDGMWLASGGNDALARVRRVQDGEEVTQIIGGSYAVSDLAFSLDGEWLAIVNSNLIRLRKPESGVMGLTMQSDQPLFCLDYSPDGHWLAAGDSASRVLLWELKKDAAVQVVGEHSGRAGRVEALVWQVDFNPQGDLLASAGGDRAVRIWDVAAREALASLSGHTGAATSASFSPDGLWLATGDLGGKLRIWGIEG
jgi:WD40 repeat protein